MARDDARRVMLIVALVGAVGGALQASRVLQGAHPAAAPPTAGMEELAAFLTPQREPVGLARPAESAILLAQDPFDGSRAPRFRPAMQWAAHSTVGTQPTQAENTEWKVSAILISETQRAAIIDQALVNVGGTLRMGARLTAVERDHVIVTDAGGRRHVVPVRGIRG